jgi:hypothetical protein
MAGWKKRNPLLPDSSTSDWLGRKRDTYIYRGHGWDMMRERAISILVKNLASMVSQDGPVRESAGELWAADLDTRTIYWRSTLPGQDKMVTDDNCMYLICHEAWHLIASSRYDKPKEISKAQEGKFHRLVNAVEDIRIERLAMKRYPGFEAARDATTKDIMAHLRRNIDGLDPVGQVGLDFILYEQTGKTLGKQYGDKAIELFPLVNKACVETSTQGVADVCYEIWKKLMDETSDDGEDHDPKPQRGQAGGVADSTMLVKGDGEFGIEPIWGDKFAGGASGNAKDFRTQQALADAALDEQNQQDMANNGAGSQAGLGTDTKPPDNNNRDWEAAARKNRGLIQKAERKIAMRLRFNSSDDWTSGLRRGSIDPAALPRLLRGDMGVFTDREEIGKVEYAWGLAVDTSSSQKGRARQLLDCTVIIAESIERCGMPLTICTWDTMLGILKPFDKKLGPYKPALGDKIMRCPGGTTEISGLIPMEQQFQRLGRQIPKVLFVITDGATNEKEHSVTMIKELGKQGIHTVGIGVGGIEPPKHHEIAVSFSKPEEIANYVPDLVAEIVRRNGIIKKR